MSNLLQALSLLSRGFLGAIAFYTLIPVPRSINLVFHHASRFAPAIGALIGIILWMLDSVFAGLAMPPFTRSGIVTIAWMVITGGLHLDGAMDTADGLAVMDTNRRLEVMADSRTGAFGVMMAIAITLLKVSALTDLTQYRGWALVLAAVWGRWGQQMAIASYSYLKPTGKGAFHKEALPSVWLCLPSLIGIAGIHGLWGFWLGYSPETWKTIVFAFGVGGAIALATGFWLNQNLGGHTGDTYGAVVELTEALTLASFTLL